MYLKELLDTNGDSTVTYRSSQSNKLRYCVCTTDFNNPHIRRFAKPISEVKENEVLVFCWDSDSFRKLNAEATTSVVPLANTLRNN